MKAVVRMRHYALSAIAAVIVLNLLLRTFVRLGGLFTTLLIASAIAIGLLLVFQWREGRAPEKGERWRLTFLYGGGLGLLYAGLLLMMTLQDTPSPMGVLLFTLHYLCYPLLTWLAFSPRRSR